VCWAEFVWDQHASSECEVQACRKYNLACVSKLKSRLPVGCRVHETLVVIGNYQPIAGDGYLAGCKLNGWTLHAQMCFELP
jgi:hypothetical protein